MNGVYVFKMGYVILLDFVVAGNKKAGIEVALVDENNEDL